MKELELTSLGFKKEYHWYILKIDDEKSIQVLDDVVRLIPYNADGIYLFEYNLDDLEKLLKLLG